MLDITQLRKDLASVVGRLERRKSPQPYLDVERFTSLESERKTIQTRTEELQARRNALSKQIGQLKSKGEDTATVMSDVAGIGDELKASAERLDVIQAELSGMLMAVPNLPQDSVPVGADESANVEVRRWGTPRAFEFAAKTTLISVPRWGWTSIPEPSSRARASAFCAARWLGCIGGSLNSCSTCKRKSMATPSATRRTS